MPTPKELEELERALNENQPSASEVGKQLDEGHAAGLQGLADALAGNVQQDPEIGPTFVIGKRRGDKPTAKAKKPPKPKKRR